MPLSKDELIHYGRHVSLREIGREGQERLKRSSALVIGLGGLGSPLALYLAAAGVGRLGLVEFDTIDASNLHRQILYGQSEVGQPKLASALARLRDLNPHIELVPHAGPIARENARALVRGYDVVADGADGFATRYLVNDACVLEGKPLVSASISGFEGQLSVFHHASGPCYRCLYPSPPPPGAVPACAEAGVLGVLPGVMGALQATEALKCLLGIGELASGRLLVYDALAMEMRAFRVARDPACAICGDRPALTELAPDYAAFCAGPGAIPEIAPTELRTWLAEGRALTLLDVREAHELGICRLAPARHLPLAELLARGLPGEDSGALIVTMCRSGARSAKAAEALQARGFQNVRNLSGGILRWIDEVDGSLTKY